MNQTFKIGNAEVTSELGTIKLEGIEVTIEGLDIPEYIQLLKALPTVVSGLRVATELSIEDLIESVDEDEAAHEIPKSPFDFFNVDSDLGKTKSSFIQDALQEIFSEQADEKKKDEFKPSSFNPLEFMIKNADKIGPAKQSIDELIKAGAPFLKIKKVSGADLLDIAQEAAKAVQREQALRARRESDKGKNTDF